MNGSYDRARIRWARWCLRAGLAAVFAYAAVAATLQPTHWIGYLPGVMTQAVPAALALKLASMLDLAIAVWLLVGWLGRFAAGVAAVMLAGILVSNTASFEVTFRDVGLLLAAVALGVLSD